MSKTKGVFEKLPGSNIWWIRYSDANGKIRREKAGSKSAAIQLYMKRKREVLEGKKLPENFRAKPVLYAELAANTLAYSAARKPRSYKDDVCRMKRIQQRFGNQVAEAITPDDIENFLNSNAKWTDGTKNRYLALIKLSFRLAERNAKVKVNPARLVRQRKENNRVIRYLNQFPPLPTNVTYLKKCADEESRLRAVIRKRCPYHLPELDIALNCGLQRSEQYGLEWSDVNFEQRILTIRRSKHGEARYVPLNAAAVAAFESLKPNQKLSPRVFVSKRGEPLNSSRDWFANAVKEAGIHHLRWHDARHSFASRLVLAGCDLRTVQELMGHKTIAVTCRYAHLAPSHQLAAVEKLSQFNPARVSPTKAPKKKRILRQVSIRRQQVSGGSELVV